jgi:hypothetical protein
MESGFCAKGGEWIKSWVYEITHMSRIGRIEALVHLAAVPSKDKELDGGPESLEGAGEAARAADEAGKVVTQHRVVGFNGIGLGLAGGGEMMAGIVDQGVVDRQVVGVVALCLRGAVKDGLHGLICPFSEVVSSIVCKWFFLIRSESALQTG